MPNLLRCICSVCSLAALVAEETPSPALSVNGVAAADQNDPLVDPDNTASDIPIWLQRPSFDEFGRSPTDEILPNTRFRLGGYTDFTTGRVSADNDDQHRLDGLGARFGLDGALVITEDLHLAAAASYHAYQANLDYDSTSDRLETTEAFLRWRPGSLIITAGRTRQWFGWERYDSPELWRVNSSYTYYNSGSLDGATIAYETKGGWLFQAGVTNEIITPRDDSDGKDSNDLGYAAKIRWQNDHKLIWDLSAFHDTNTAPNIVNGAYDDVTVISSWVEWRNINDSAWSLAADSAYSNNPNGEQFFALAVLRIDGELAVPGFLSLMATSLIERYDDQASTRDDLYNNERYELAFSVFAFPTSEPNLRLGLELRALDSSAFKEDEQSAHLQFVASF